MLKLRYDIFGANVLGDATFAGKYEFPCSPVIKVETVPASVLPFDRLSSAKPGDWIHFYVHDKRFHNVLARGDIIRRSWRR